MQIFWCAMQIDIMLMFLFLWIWLKIHPSLLSKFHDMIKHFFIVSMFLSNFIQIHSTQLLCEKKIYIYFLTERPENKSSNKVILREDKYFILPRCCVRIFFALIKNNIFSRVCQYHAISNFLWIQFLKISF